MKIDTQALHAGFTPEPETGATAPPIFQTTAYAYETAEELSDVFCGRAPGYVYTRMANPTTTALERRLAEMEGGIGCVTCSSGMSAIACVAVALTRAGDHILSSAGIFGGTVSFFAKTLSRYRVETSLVDCSDVSNFEREVRPNTRFIFVETIGNPKMDVPDLPALAELAGKSGIPLVVDSTVTTPAILRPAEFGANIVIHSLSKFVNGHGNSIGGAVVDCGNYDWASSPYEDIRQLASKAGKLALLAYLRTLVYRDLGCCPSPFNSFLHLQGLEGLPMRMERHCENALALARFLAGHPAVRWVNYPGLESSAYRKRAAGLFGGRFGGLLTFGTGSAESAMRTIDRLKLALNLANLGDSKTLVIHPASTIFQEFTPEAKAAMGVSDDLIRVSVGVENIDDIIADFDQALR